MRKLVVCLTVALCSVMTMGQEVVAQNASPRLEQFFEERQLFKGEKYEGDYYVLLQFKDLPAKVQTDLLKRKQIRLLSFRSNNTYLAAVPAAVSAGDLAALGIVDINRLSEKKKLSPALQSKDYPHWALSGNGQVEVAIELASKMPLAQVQTYLEAAGLELLDQQLLGGRIHIGRIAEDQLAQLAQLPIISYIDVVQEPAKRLNHENCLMQRVNVLNSAITGASNLNGIGVTVGIGDGGELGNHIDFSGRVINKASGTYSSFGAHGDHVAGIIGGKGNLNPRHRGMASGCNLLIQKTSLITYYTEEYYSDFNMVLTNNSYGTSFNCTSNGTYNYSSQNLDWQMRNFPDILHVFAAGNSGTKTCEPYPQGYKTVLRYYQSAKNVLTVGSVAESREVWASSSRGPVADGRIKPEICGIGAGVYSTGRDYDYWRASGTSMASPSVTGTLALLYERYRQLNNDENPDGGLIKAIACNTADDLGNVGPDFIYGFGLINGRRAVETIEHAQYFSGELENEQQHSQTIEVPTGMKQLKVMLYWHDKEAAAYVRKALINNLDVEMTDPSGQIFQPWVLNHDTLEVDELPRRMADTLNNIEQITIDTPIAGTYTLTIKGSEIPVGPQEYFVTYQWIGPEVVVTFPYGGESLLPEAEEMIQWDTDDTNTSTFEVEYSLDDGSTWEMVASGVSADQRHVDWTVPNTFTEAAQVRVTKTGAGISATSEASFVIMQSPQDLIAAPFCDEIVKLDWLTVDQAASYEIYMFDGVEMTAIGTSIDTSYLVTETLDVGSRYWFSVRAISANGIYSERAIAVDVTAESGTACQWDNDLKFGSLKIDVKIGRESTASALSSTEQIGVLLNNEGTSPVSNFTVKYTINGGEEIAEICTETIPPGDSLIFQFSQKADLSGVGEHTIDAWLEFEEDEYTLNDGLEEMVYVKQIANAAITFPAAMGFDESLDLSASKNTMGLDGLEKWDFETAGNGLLYLNDGIMTLSPELQTSTQNIDNNAIITMNMSQVDINGWGVFMNFKYAIKTSTIGPLFDQDSQFDKVWIRGSDADEWVELIELDQVDGDWKEVNGLNISSVLQDAGQSYSSSTQIQFSQKQSAGYSLGYINFFSGNPLPVELHAFHVGQVGSSVVLGWKTSSERDNDYFDVQVALGEEAMTRNEFATIGRVEGAGNSDEIQEYEFVDEYTPGTDMRYYRLKQVDRDQQAYFSPIKALSFELGQALIDVSPNPFQEDLQVLYKGPDSEEVTLMLTNLSGQVLFQTKAALRQYELINLDLAEGLANGIYLLKIHSPNGATSLKLVKQR